MNELKINDLGVKVEEATSLIVRGFLDVDIFGLPEELSMEIKKLVEKLAGGL